MIGAWRERLFSSWPLLSLGAVILVLLACIGLATMAIGRYVWAEYCFHAATQALDQNDLATARDYLTRCLASRPGSSDAHFLAAQTARRSLDYEEAQRHYRECLKLGGAQDRIELERALSTAQRGNLTQVEGFLLALARQGDHPDTVLILEALSRGYLSSLRFEAADVTLNLWLERRPDDVQALIWRGDVHERMLHKKEALAAYALAVEMSPDRDDARLHLAELLLRARQPEEAQHHLDILRQRQPQNPAVFLALARCRRLQGKPEEARTLLDEGLEVAPRDASLHSERGLLALESGQAKAAEPHLRRAVSLTPYDRESIYTLSQCLEQNGKRAEARECRRKLEEIDAQVDRLAAITRQISVRPRDIALRHEAGMIFLQSAQPEQGLRWLRSALEIDPLYPPTHLALADYFEKLSDHSQASWHRELAMPNILEIIGP